MRVKNLLSKKAPEILMEVIAGAIDRADGNISYAARLLEIDPANLRRLMRKIHFPGYPGKVKPRAKSSAGSGSAGADVFR